MLELDVHLPRIHSENGIEERYILQRALVIYIYKEDKVGKLQGPDNSWRANLANTTYRGQQFRLLLYEKQIGELREE